MKICWNNTPGYVIYKNTGIVDESLLAVINQIIQQVGCIGMVHPDIIESNVFRNEDTTPKQFFT